MSRIAFSYVFVCMCHRITSLTARLFRNYYNANLYSNKNKEAFNENIQRAKIKQVL